MARNYIDGDSTTFVRTEMCVVDMLCPDGTRVCGLEPRRLFPVSGGDTYITLLDSDAHEVAIIRDVSTLAPGSRTAILDALHEYYLIPKITAVLDINEKNGGNRWTVETESGTQIFQIQNRHSDIKPFTSGRVLIRDANDNRYEIPDFTRLDKHSRHLLNSQI